MSCTSSNPAMDREQTILAHLPQVRLIAQSYHRRCPAEVSLEDLISVGTIGLIQAVDRFDPQRGLLVKTLAEHRIRGAILDYLRQLDPLPRAVRKFVQRREQLLVSCREAQSASPSDEEIAASLDVPLAKYRRLVSLFQATHVSHLEELKSRDVPCCESASDRIHKRILLERIIGSLPVREALFARACVEGLSAKDIANRFSISESSVAFLKRNILLRTRRYLDTRVVPSMTQRPPANVSAAGVAAAPM